MLGIVKQPILVFGLGASGALWLFDSFGNRFTDFGDWGVWGLIIVGIALWRLGGRQPGTGVDVLPSQFNQAEVEQALNRVRNNLKVLLAESDSDEDLCGFQERLEALEQTDEQRSLTLGVTGRKGVGKTALVRALQTELAQGSTLELQIQDLPSCLQGDDSALLAEAQQTDVLLLVTDGDIRESELDLVEKITASGQALLLVWNQSDRHPPEEQAQILGRIRQQAEPYLRGDRILAIAAAPTPIEVRLYKTDNSIETSTTTPPPELASLSECLETLHRDAGGLIWATTYRAAQSLRREIRQEINRLRRHRALPVVRQSQWIAAAAAFGNPLPSLDLLATAAVNVQLVMNLGKIYQQKLSLEQAKVAAKNFGRDVSQARVSGSLHPAGDGRLETKPHHLCRWWGHPGPQCCLFDSHCRLKSDRIL